MKRIITLIAALIIGAISYAQTPSKTDIGSKKVYYLEVYETSWLTAKSVSMNWGINTPNPLTQTFKLSNQNDEVINFDNVIGALNYLGSYGWELVSVYQREVKNIRVTYYLLKLDAKTAGRNRITDIIDEALSNL